jgi:parallel beta-helix repeat protein
MSPRTPRLLLVLSVVFILATIAVITSPNQAPGLFTAFHTSPATSVIELSSFLPSKPAVDGSVDYTLQAQAAIHAAQGRTLRLPPFPIKVSKRPGQNWCLLVTQPIHIVGSPRSAIVELSGRVQILRCEDVEGLVLEHFTVIGKGGQGQGLGHGIVQITGGRNILVDGLNILDSDADAIAIANASDVRLVNCHVERASKAGLYLSNCTRGVIANNTVSNLLGHVTSDNRIVGAAIQMSSNTGVVCSSNVLQDGLGIGILCDANLAQKKPEGCVIANNRVHGFTNPTNPQTSCGIKCANANADHATQTLVTGNSIRGCGVYGLYMENHGGSQVTSNQIVESESSGLVVGTLRDLLVENNQVLNSDTSFLGGQAGIYLVNGASGVIVRGNDVRNSSNFAPAGTSAALFDASSGTDNQLEPRIAWGGAAPGTGTWTAGDRVFARTPQLAGPLGWICISGGTPGTWMSFGKLE